MDMIKISSGKLRAIGYDNRARILQVLLEDGSTLQYNGISEDLWRRFRHSGSAAAVRVSVVWSVPWGSPPL